MLNRYLSDRIYPSKPHYCPELLHASRNHPPTLTQEPEHFTFGTVSESHVSGGVQSICIFIIMLFTPMLKFGSASEAK